MDIRRLGDNKVVLGEGPYWDPVDMQLYYLDIRSNEIWRYNPKDGSFRSWETPVPPAAISRTKDDRFVAALADGFYDFDPDSGRFDVIARVEFDHDWVGLNDAKVDRQGRFIAGASNNRKGGAIAAVYSFDGERITKIDDGFTICNGPCWSPDGTTFYIADTGPDIIYAYDYDPRTGAVSDKRVFSDTTEVSGSPDGATVDADGRVWWTFVLGTGELICYDTDGTVHQRFATDLKWMTSIMFGGPDFSSIYLTTLDPEKLGRPERDPATGPLYEMVGIGATGLPEAFALR